VLVRNPQREPITIAVATVDDAIVPFTTDGPDELGRLRSTKVVIPYDWVAEEPIAVGLTSSTGIQTSVAIGAAVETPTASARGFLGYGIVGLLVGVVPVALGLLWLPSLRRLDARWLGGFLALTCGLLTFLGVEALFEAFTLQAGLPGAIGGPGLVLLGVALATLGMTLVSTRLGRGSGATGLALALLVAIGIGLHNLGEGLAIGTSFALGELQLGTFFVIGFMVHNLTEGLGIAAPAARERVSVAQLCGLALVAGAPAILGTWIGGYATNDTLSVLFFGLAAGAALQVVIEVGRYVARTTPGGLRSGAAIGGFLAGIAVMWATGLLVG
jgi:ZIP family zinc transporter